MIELEFEQAIAIAIALVSELEFGLELVCKLCRQWPLEVVIDTPVAVDMTAIDMPAIGMLFAVGMLVVDTLVACKWFADRLVAGMFVGIADNLVVLTEFDFVLQTLDSAMEPTTVWMGHSQAMVICWQMGFPRAVEHNCWPHFHHRTVKCTVLVPEIPVCGASTSMSVPNWHIDNLLKSSGSRPH